MTRSLMSVTAGDQFLMKSTPEILLYHRQTRRALIRPSLFLLNTHFDSFSYLFEGIFFFWVLSTPPCSSCPQITFGWKYVSLHVFQIFVKSCFLEFCVFLYSDDSALKLLCYQCISDFSCRLSYSVIKLNSSLMQLGDAVLYDFYVLLISWMIFFVYVFIMFLFYQIFLFC